MMQEAVCMQDVSVCTSLGPSPWVKGKHMEQGQHSMLYSWFFGFGYTIAEESSVHTVDMLYLVRLNICWPTRHGEKGTVA